MSNWKALADELPPTDENLAVLLYDPALVEDLDFPGHPYVVSNPEYCANGNAAKRGYTHWLPIEPFDLPLLQQKRKELNDLNAPWIEAARQSGG